MRERNWTRLGSCGAAAGLRDRAVVGITVALVLCLSQARSAEDKITAIKGGDLYTITSGVIRNGTLLVKDGKIWQIGQGLEIPKDANVVDATGKVVMPGLVAAATIFMPAAGSSSQKIAESLDPFNYSLSMALASGVTSIFARARNPSGDAAIGGSNAVIKPAYGDLDGMLLKEPVAENVNIASYRWMQRTDFILKMRQAKNYLQRLADYEKAKAKDEKLEAPKKPSDIDPYLRLLRREVPARMTAASAADIVRILELTDEFPCRVIIEGAAEAWTVADEIAARDVALVIAPRAKERPNEDISQPSGSTVRNAAVLKKAGVRFAIIPSTPYFSTGGFAGRDLMTLPMDAAAAVSGGLDEQTALEAITITAAQILGVDDRVGSLQVGKDADILILDGHPLHYDTFVQMTFVNGKLLYEKDKSVFFSHIRRYDDKVNTGPIDPREHARGISASSEPEP